ncbi:alpha/beta-type small acid-soluble spore protein [Paenibacillus antri]|uniref:Alpha/beta-type small acid-soluble spore protein n=1 Tax=Paenibacillus antri TaxID=2582848 RepID=A0A5R9G685_9BACL|nr:alpha/beta-type small acid-soluble spore protein [Paenibacillus antri]TLS50559.1 alpha/beta-type small acid-soluble spore protein [Paenibacillus antri]
MAKGSAKRNQLVPESHKALDALKYEIAAELGLPVGRNKVGAFDAEFAGELGETGASGYNGKEDYWGHIASRDTGAVGGHITRHLIRKAQQDLFESMKQ